MSLVDPIPYLFESLQRSATSRSTGVESTPEFLASRQRSWSHSRASRLSRPWSLIENRSTCWQLLLIGRAEGQARGPGKSPVFLKESSDRVAVVVSGSLVKVDEFTEEGFGLGPDSRFIEGVLRLGESGTPTGF